MTSASLPARYRHPALVADQPLSTAIESRLRETLDQPARRITRLDVAGQVFWLKRVEQHSSLRWRLQKGDPAAGFAAEIAALHRLIALGAPVPRLLAEGPGWGLTADAGPTLETLVTAPDCDDARAIEVTSSAARALAAFHARGWRHGRPKLRDICLSPSAGIVLIDFERFVEAASIRQRGLDVAILAHSILETLGPRPDILHAAMDAYREAAPAGCWEEALRMVRRWGRLGPLLRLAAWWRPDRAEVQSMALLPRLMRA